jgi:molecular chaperone DnaK
MLGGLRALLVKARRIDDLARLYLDQLAAAPNDRGILDRLAALYREHAEKIESPQLREAGARLVTANVEVGLREAFDRGAAAWIKQARREIEKRYGRIWGMDLGTSKSAVAVFDLEAGKAVICPDKGQPHFSSTLALDKAGHEIVGLDMVEQLRADLRGCIEASKRAMGTRKTYRIGERHFSPEEVGARLLAHGRGLVEAYLREQVATRAMTLARGELGDACDASWLDGKGELAIGRPQAVITIPAYFNFVQRRATRDAVGIAGLDVQRLVPDRCVSERGAHAQARRQAARDRPRRGHARPQLPRRVPRTERGLLRGRAGVRG